VKVRVEWSLLGRSSEPFLVLGTMDAQGCVDERLRRRVLPLEERLPRAPRVARRGSAAGATCRKDIADDRFESAAISEHRSTASDTDGTP
jgi:hypothetical protein